MLLWLPAAILPFVIARWALPPVHRVPWGAIDLVSRAARQSGLLSSNALLVLLLRASMLVLVALAAARPFLPAFMPASTATPTRVRIVNGNPNRRIEVVAPDGAAGADGKTLSIDRLPAIASAIIALARSGGLVGNQATENPVENLTQTNSPTVDAVRLSDAGRLPDREKTSDLLILCDGVIPGPLDAARLSRAVEAGARLLVLVGPATVESADRYLLSQWLESLIGVTIAGQIACSGGRISIDHSLTEAIESDGLNRGNRADHPESWSVLAGPSVGWCADIVIPQRADTTAPAGAISPRLDSVPTVLARVAPAGHPLLIEMRAGRGRVCVSALPLSLSMPDARPVLANDSWSDVAAWPVFVPLVDRLLSRLLDTDSLAAASPPPPGPAVSALKLSAPALAAFKGLPLAGIALVLAAALALLAQRLSGARERRGSALAQVAILGSLVAMFIAWSGQPPAPQASASDKPPLALLIDVSPSMATADVLGDGDRAILQPRLSAVLAALSSAEKSASLLQQLSRERKITLATIDSEIRPRGSLTPVTSASATVGASLLQGITAIAAAPQASRQADAIERTIADAPDRLSAVIVVSDGAITAGRSWSAAARFAASRNVAIVAIPVGGGGTLSENSDPDAALDDVVLTAANVPRVCWLGEDVAIGVRAEMAATALTSIPIVLSDPNGRPCAQGHLQREISESTASQTELEPAVFSGHILWKPLVLGPQTMLLAAGRTDPGYRQASAVSVATTVIVDPVRILLVDTAPRFEFRFLAHLLAGDSRFQLETCLLEAIGDARMRPTTALPATATEWNQFDVVALGDVPLSGMDALPAAVADDGIGVAWMPGRRVREQILAASKTADWLPAMPLEAAGVSALPGGRRLEIAPSALQDGWFFSTAQGVDSAETADSLGSTPFTPEVFDCFCPVRLRPTARILAVSLPLEVSVTAAHPPYQQALPAILLDQSGAATILGQLCETWRWREHDGRAVYEKYWRTALMKLAQTHLLSRLASATIEIHPLRVQAGDSARIDVTPTRRTAAQAGWYLEHVARAQASGEPETIERIEIPDSLPPEKQEDLSRATVAPVVRLEQLEPGWHALRLFTLASPTIPLAAIDFFVASRKDEQPGPRARVEAMMSAALASGGAVVPLNRIATLPDTIAQIDARMEQLTGRHSVERRLFSAESLANLLMITLLVACAVDWSLRDRRPFF